MNPYAAVHPLVDPDATYLVTGGAGFIGSHLVEALTGAGARVRVLDDFSTGYRKNLEPFLGDGGAGTGSGSDADAPGRRGEVELIEGSVTDPDLCRRACEGVDFVFHEAAIPSVARSVEDPVSSHEADATGTLNVLVAARDAGVERVVYAASSSAYGDTPTLPKVESMAAHPMSPYAVAKLTGEHYAAAFAHVYDLETVSLRYFNIFGPRQDPTSQYAGVIPIFIRCAVEGASPTIDGDGEQTRDFTYVENVVRANLLATRADAEGAVGRTFNVGCGERISINRLWTVIRDAVGADVESTHGPPRPGDVRDSLASLERIEEALGYVPEVKLEEGLERTVEWFREAEPVG